MSSQSRWDVKRYKQQSSMLKSLKNQDKMIIIKLKPSSTDTL